MWTTSQSCSQGTVSSAPSAVFEMAFFGGWAVIPQRQSFWRPTPSAARKNAPTLYMLRTLSRRTATGSMHHDGMTDIETDFCTWYFGTFVPCYTSPHEELGRAD